MVALPKIQPPFPGISKPRLSVRSAAKFVGLPAVRQMQLLHDQKFPKQEPQIFKQPYYGPPIQGIRAFFERGNVGLVDARAQIQRISAAPRRMHCTRVLESFMRSEHAERKLVPVVAHRYVVDLYGLEMRLSPDLVAQELGEDRYIYFNANAQQFDPETARLTMEFAYWLLRESDVKVEPKQIEFIDLFAGVLYRGRSPRKSRLKDLEANARLIASLWPSIEP